MESVKKYIFPIMCIACLAGVGVGTWLSDGVHNFVASGWVIGVWLGAIAIPVVILGIARRTEVLIFAAIILIGCAIGIARYSVMAIHEEHRPLDRYVGTVSMIEGMVAENPERRPNGTRIVIRPESRNNNPDAVLEHERIQVTLADAMDISYGDRVRVTGTITKPENFYNDYGKEFDYINYLRVNNIFYLMSRADTTIVSSGNGSKIFAALYDVHNWSVDTASRFLRGDAASLLSGILIGEKSGITSDMNTMFRKSGLVHIVVLSGYNITVVADMLVGVFRHLGQALGFGMGALGIITFVLMTGAGSTAVRAGLMAVVLLVARRVGRKYVASRALLGAGVVMVMLNPKVLAYDLSFELSFLATAGLIYVAPIMESWMSRVPERFGVRDILVTTLSTQVAVLPFLLVLTPVIPLVAVPANLLVVWMIPGVMLLGALIIMIGSIVPFVGTILATPLEWVLKYIIGVAHFFSSLPFGSIPVGVYSRGLMVVIYSILIVLIVRWYRRRDMPLP